MIFEKVKNLDRLTKDVILVFLGTSLANIFNLLYQLFIVRRLSVADFAAFNVLLTIIGLFTTPAATLVPAVSKYAASFRARNMQNKIALLINKVSSLSFISGLALFTVLFSFSAYITGLLKIPGILSTFIALFIILLSWLIPVYTGALQGLERFGWLTSGSITTGVFKLVLVVIFVRLGFGITGVLGAFLIACVVSLSIYLMPLKDYVVRHRTGRLEELGEIIRYLLPVSAASFCFMSLVSSDMVFVKYYFNATDAGYYSVAQLVGKIFLFLPVPVSIAMFPKTAGLNAKQQDTVQILKKSLSYAAILCLLIAAGYNMIPSLFLKVLTGKDFAMSIALGRVFSISMSLYAVIFMLLSYHMSIGDFRFLKSLAVCTVLQALAMVLFHQNLFVIQVIMCINALFLVIFNLRLGLIEARGKTQ